MLLEARNICFSYSPKAEPVLHNLSFAVEEGERVAVVAPSGFGKTTLVKLLAGYIQPQHGQVLLAGRPLPKRGSLPIQLIPQHPEQAINPRWRMRRMLAEAGPIQPQVLADLGIEPAWLERFPNELSGGELQRFCVARAVGGNTRFLLADEISTMLDVITQAQIWHYLIDTCNSRKMGLVMVTHNLDLAACVATRVVDLSASNGLL